MQHRVKIYVLAVVAASILVLSLLYRAEPEVDLHLFRAALTFGALGFILHSFEYTTGRSASGSSALLPFFTAMFLAPHWQTVVILSTTVALKEVFARREFLKGLFNAANAALASGLAIGTYKALGGTAFAWSQELNVVPYVAMFAVGHISNTLGVSTAVALSQGQPVRRTWRENTHSTAPYDLLSLPFIYAFASVYLTWGVIGALALALPLLGVRQLYKTNWQLERINHELLELMVAAIEARDPYTSGHSRRVSRNARVIARTLGLSSKQIERVGVAALLHDVGKIHEIFAPILRKPERLSSEERATMETHPIKSAELVQNVSSLKDIVPAVRHHHENWDGSGYPDGLAEEEIPLFARIIMVADTIDAMTTDRPYRLAMTEVDVRRELQRMSGRQFDPSLCEALLHGSVLSSLIPSPADELSRARQKSPESRSRIASA